MTSGGSQRDGGQAGESQSCVLLWRNAPAARLSALDTQLSADWEVKLVVRRSDSGTLIEEGVAVLEESGGWRYVATQALPAGTALSLTLTVTDEDEIQVTRTVPLVVA
jgi:hypothetical protein